VAGLSHRPQTTDAEVVHMRAVSSGSPAIMTRSANRPVDLRPRLSTGLPCFTVGTTIWYESGHEQESGVATGRQIATLRAATARRLSTKAANPRCWSRPPLRSWAASDLSAWWHRTSCGSWSAWAHAAKLWVSRHRPRRTSHLSCAAFRACRYQLGRARNCGRNGPPGAGAGPLSGQSLPRAWGLQAQDQPPTQGVPGARMRLGQQW